ncbi:unnamed protein product [Didymodactylos carnosus]|uniref:Uncharacterized protein n=1 Tax=Didymodactylos carnosus TaxID=1234261 RepID=A0A815SNM2_9BILA|nr:unnamed protein product [Didymodactylos carnosus]CAF1493160.1 unnamed protein product [Didymodactylos carnosus]CAF4186097.1 unnamed protein product [Didymodactylos carnosus]CAF4355977.1 unnamed protein product [Didymodactylos carnosus]
MYSKAKVQLHRIAGALHVAKVASEVIAQCGTRSLKYHDLSKETVTDKQRVVDLYITTTNYQTIQWIQPTKRVC